MFDLWLNVALKNQARLKVILVTGDYQPPGPPLLEQLPIAILDGLLPGLSAETVRRGAYKERRGFVHAKTVLVDVRWVLVGSANLARCSFYTDIEHALAVVDPQDEWVRDYRAALWSRHLDGQARNRNPSSCFGS